MKRTKKKLRAPQKAFRNDPTDHNADEYQTAALECWYDDVIDAVDLLEILYEIKYR